MSVYLLPADLNAYGISTETTAAQILQASATIDAYLVRPEGLVYGVDGAGAPAYMLNLQPTRSLSLNAAVTASPSTAVLPVAGPTAFLQQGDVLTLDRATPSLTEVVVITSVAGNQVSVAGLQFDHSSGAKLEYGLQIFETRKMPKARPITGLSRYPVQQLLSGRGRYGYGRRGSSNEFNLNTFNLLASVQKFGGPPMWETFQVASLNVDYSSGRLWVPAGILLAYYSEIAIYYIAGFPEEAIPTQVKQACANLINAAMASEGTPPNVETIKAGTYSTTMFNSSLMDDDTKAMLNPYRLRAFG